MKSSLPTSGAFYSYTLIRTLRGVLREGMGKGVTSSKEALLNSMDQFAVCVLTDDQRRGNGPG